MDCKDMPAEVRRRAVRHGGSPISFLETGEGDAVVLLHGIGSAATSWGCVLTAPALVARHRLIAWDAPGYGDSAPLAADWPTAQGYAEALAALLDTLGIAQAHLVGHSLGALMAARFAAAYPQRTLSLSLVSIATGHRHLTDDERRRRLVDRVGNLEKLGAHQLADLRGPRLVAPQAPQEVRAKVIHAMAQVKVRGYTQAARMLSQGDIYADVRSLPGHMPVQIILGDADQITSVEQNMSVSRQIPRAPVHVLHGVGHAAYVEDPDTLVSYLAPFIEKSGKEEFRS